MPAKKKVNKNSNNENVSQRKEYFIVSNNFFCDQRH